MNLEVARPSCKEAIITWNRVSIANKYTVTVKDLSRFTFLQTVSTQDTPLCRYRLPDPLTPGHKYQVTVKAKLGNPDFETLLREESIEFRAVFTQNELEQLYQKAINFVKYGGQDSITWFYRNKPKTYFDDIEKNHAGIMKVYIKDNNGDPASIINGQINGLFFASHLVAATNSIPDRSPFGEVRLLIPAFSLLANYGARLYFADFYCNHKWHYVTLVLTTVGSATDKFCRENLILVDMSKNPFLIQRGSELLVTKTAHIEVLYTEDIDIVAWEENCGAHRTRVVSTGTSKPGGLPKRAHCTVCNLDPTITNQDFDDVAESARLREGPRSWPAQFLPKNNHPLSPNPAPRYEHPDAVQSTVTRQKLLVQITETINQMERLLVQLSEKIMQLLLELLLALTGTVAKRSEKMNQLMKRVLELSEPVAKLGEKTSQLKKMVLELSEVIASQVR